MATTDTKPGFRLPWSSERGEPANPADGAPEEATGGSSHPPQENETPDMIDAVPATDSEAAVETSAAPEPTPATAEPEPVAPAAAAPAPATSKKPNKFMADLTKAMQAAAETAREDSLARFNAEAKVHIENIHATSATEATDLRKQADDDVAAIRDWSKTEIARIREETDERITHRKAALEGEIEEHAAYIERRIERVQARVSAFEAEMAEFFDRLLAEDDPTRFAAMAESLPEPPPFDGEAPEPRAAATATPVVDAVAEPLADVQPETAEASTEVVADQAEATVANETEQPAAEAVAETVAEVAPETADASADAGDLFGMSADAPADDPRLSALGMTPDFAAAEAEAATFSAPSDGDDDEVPVIADDALAARLADLVPDGEGAPTTTTTRLTVTGLISVASIAGFKRHLSRVPGVQSVGVSSGPDGEFVFAVTHGPEIVLRDVIPTLPSYSARVTAESDGELTVAARDPEAEG